MIREHPDIFWHLNSFQRKQTLLAPKIADRIQMIVCFGSTLDHKLYLVKQINFFFLSNRNEATANSFYFHTWQDRVNMQHVIWFLMTENDPLQISITKQTYVWKQTLNKRSSELRTADVSWKVARHKWILSRLKLTLCHTFKELENQTVWAEPHLPKTSLFHITCGLQT